MQRVKNSFDCNLTCVHVLVVINMKMLSTGLNMAKRVCHLGFRTLCSGIAFIVWLCQFSNNSEIDEQVQLSQVHCYLFKTDATNLNKRDVVIALNPSSTKEIIRCHYMKERIAPLALLMW